MAEPLQIIQVAVDQLEPHPQNPNRMNGAMMAKLKENIERRGVYKPIRVRRLSVGNEVGNYQIVGGHQTVAACKELGIKEVPAVVMELNDYEALQLMLNDNEIHGEQDPLAEARALEAMAEHRTLEEIAEDTVHDQARVEQFLALLKKDEKKAVAFTANKDAAEFLNIEAAFSGDEARLVKEALALTGKRDHKDAVYVMAKHYFETRGETA